MRAAKRHKFAVVKVKHRKPKPHPQKLAKYTKPVAKRITKPKRKPKMAKSPDSFSSSDPAPAKSAASDAPKVEALEPFDPNKKWDPDNLNKWLENPQNFAPGTKMTFAGFPQAQNRADVIKYLQSLK